MPTRSAGTSTKHWNTGKERDLETGWDYFGARYYNPAIARWMNVDPMSEMYPSWTPYNYVGNNPIQVIDLNGECWYQNGKGGTPQYFEGCGARDGWTNIGEEAYGLLKSGGYRHFQHDGKTYDYAKGDINQFSPEAAGYYLDKNQTYGYEEFWTSNNLSIPDFSGGLKDASVALFSEVSGLNDAKAAYQDVKEGDWVGATWHAMMILPVTKGGKAVKAADEVVDVARIVAKNADDAGEVLRTLDKVWPYADDLPDATRLMQNTGDCDKVAEKIHDAIGGEIYKVEGIMNGEVVNQLGRIRNINGHLDVEWQNHIFVLKDGIVYDGLTGKAGMPVGEYFKQLLPDLAEESWRKLTKIK